MTLYSTKIGRLVNTNKLLQLKIRFGTPFGELSKFPERLTPPYDNRRLKSV